jgi:hypothetical protein
MSNNVKVGVKFEKRPTNKGVFMKHFFVKVDTDETLNNLEVNIVSDFQIATYIHEDASEFFMW